MREPSDSFRAAVLNIKESEVMRSTFTIATATFCGVMLLAASPLLAQEELPAPPKSTPAFGAPTAPKPDAPTAKLPTASNAAAPKAAAPKAAAQKSPATNNTTAKATAPKAAAPRVTAPRVASKAPVANQTPARPAQPIQRQQTVIVGPPGPVPPFIPFGPGFIPPLPPLPADRAAVRAMRIDRLRAMGIQAVDAFLPPDGSGPAGAEGARIGAAVAPIAQALLGEGMIEKLTVKIDPAGTNLREDRVKLDTVANLRQTPWAADPSKFAGQVSAKVVPTEAGPPVAAVDGKIQFQTQTLPLLNYALTQYKLRAGEAAQADSPQTQEELLQSRINAKLQTVDAIRSIDEVADLMNQIAAIRLQLVNEEIEGIREELANAIDDATRKPLETALTTVRVKRDKLLEVRSKTVRGPDGVAQSISLQLAQLDLFPGADLKVFDVRLTDTEITATVVGNVHRYVEFYPLAKPVLVGTLDRIQSGDPQAVETLRRTVNAFLSQGLRTLAPGAEPTPAPEGIAPPAPVSPDAAPLEAPAPADESLPTP